MPSDGVRYWPIVPTSAQLGTCRRRDGGSSNGARWSRQHGVTGTNSAVRFIWPRMELPRFQRIRVGTEVNFIEHCARR